MGRPAQLVRGTVRGAAELLLTCGAVVLLFALYLVVWSDVQTAAAQGDLRDDFAKLTEQAEPATKAEAAKAAAAPAPPVGTGIAQLRIPRLGEDWSWVVVEGVSTDQLKQGPGRFPDTTMLGQIGNAAIAGHRATHGEPFAHLDKLQAGDQIYVTTPTVTYTYEVTRQALVAPSEVDVLLPVPYKPDAKPRKARLTLVTCHPRWGSSERLIVHANLVAQTTGMES